MYSNYTKINMNCAIKVIIQNKKPLATHTVVRKAHRKIVFIFYIAVAFLLS